MLAVVASAKLVIFDSSCIAQSCRHQQLITCRQAIGREILVFNRCQTIRGLDAESRRPVQDVASEESLVGHRWNKRESQLSFWNFYSPNVILDILLKRLLFKLSKLNRCIPLKITGSQMSAANNDRKNQPLTAEKFAPLQELKKR